VGGYNDQNSLNKHLWRPYNNNYGNGHDSAPKPEITAPAAWIPSPLLPGSREETEARWLASMLVAKSEDDIKALLGAGYKDLLIVPAFAQNPDPGVFALLQERVNKYKLIDARHQHVDGTSVSTAVASSIVAQLLEINPALAPAQVKQILIDTAHPLPGLAAHHQGAGYIVAGAAVKSVLTLHKASSYES
jgi:serine protease AprX